MPGYIPTAPVEVRQLDGGYSREARSLLYHAYRHEPTFAYLFEAERPGYEQRVRATVRELVQQHFFQELPAIGLLIEERLSALEFRVGEQDTALRRVLTLLVDWVEREQRMGDAPHSAAA